MQIRNKAKFRKCQPHIQPNLAEELNNAKFIYRSGKTQFKKQSFTYEVKNVLLSLIHVNLVLLINSIQCKKYHTLQYWFRPLLEDNMSILTPSFFHKSVHSWFYQLNFQIELFYSFSKFMVFSKEATSKNIGLIEVT